MKPTFYELYEQDDDYHASEMYYYIGTPTHSFEDVVSKAKERFLLVSSEGEEASEWATIDEALLQAGFQYVKPKESAEVTLRHHQNVLHLMLPEQFIEGENETYTHSSFAEEINSLREQYGKPALTVEELLGMSHEKRPAKESNTPDHFVMGDLEVFLSEE